jgi:hypothetical protein
MTYFIAVSNQVQNKFSLVFILYFGWQCMVHVQLWVQSVHCDPTYSVTVYPVHGHPENHRVHRVATTAFWRTFSDEGKISPCWWGWGVHAHPLSLHLPSPVKLQCTLQLSGQIHWPCLISTNICTLCWKPRRNFNEYWHQSLNVVFTGHFCLGWFSNFVGSESGQKQSVKLLQNMVYNKNLTTTCYPPPSSSPTATNCLLYIKGRW